MVKTWVIIDVCSVTQSWPTLYDSMDCSLPDFSVHRIFQAQILEWVAISCSWGSSRLRNRICVSCVSCTGRRILYHWVIQKPLIIDSLPNFCSYFQLRTNQRKLDMCSQPITEDAYFLSPPPASPDANSFQSGYTQSLPFPYSKAFLLLCLWVFAKT